MQKTHTPSFFSPPLLFLIGSLLGCAPKPHVVYDTDPNSVFRIEWQGLGNENRYDARVLWPDDPNYQTFEIHQIAGEVIDKRQPTEGRVVIGPLSSGEHLSLELWGLHKDVWTRLKALEADVPTDLVVRGSSDAATLFAGRTVIPHRLFFAPGSQLILNGQPFELSIDELYANGGSIRSFPEGQGAAIDHDGRSAAPIRLHVGALTGELILDPRGEAGGNGHAGVKGSKGDAGAPVYSGKCNDGGPGRTGENGWDGGRGGKSGDITLVVDHLNASAQISIVNQVASGGHGGAGGAGGDGGDAGVALAMMPSAGAPTSYICWQPSLHSVPGPTGYTGHAGADGAPGPSGSLTSNVPFTRSP